MSSPETPSGTPQERPGALLPVIAAWLVPGAGHALLRRPWPALFVFLAVVPLFVFGMALTGWENVSFERHPFYLALHAPAGLVALAGELLTRGVLPNRLMPHGTEGTLFSAVAGLLNLMAVTDVWARVVRGDPEDRKKGARADASTAPAPAGESAHAG